GGCRATSRSPTRPRRAGRAEDPGSRRQRETPGTAPTRAARVASPRQEHGTEAATDRVARGSTGAAESSVRLGGGRARLFAELLRPPPRPGPAALGLGRPAGRGAPPPARLPLIGRLPPSPPAPPAPLLTPPDPPPPRPLLGVRRLLAPPQPPLAVAERLPAL